MLPPTAPVTTGRNINKQPPSKNQGAVWVAVAGGRGGDEEAPPLGVLVIVKKATGSAANVNLLDTRHELV